MEKPIFSLSALNEVSRGNDAFVRKMLLIFCEQTPQPPKQMQEAFTANDLNRVAKIAHQLKPSINGLEIVSLKHVIADLESLPGRPAGTGEISQMLTQVSTVTNEVIERIKSDHLPE